MAAKKTKNSALTRSELVGGLIFFFIYFLVMPFALTPLLRALGDLLGTTISASLGNMLYYYALFVVTLILFWHFLGGQLSRLFQNLNRCAITFVMGLIAFYGLNELFYRLTNTLFQNHTNLNDVTIAAQAGVAPHSMAVIIILLSPFVEEVLFRGLIFGALRENSRAIAYILSCALFAFAHVFRPAVFSLDLTYLTLMLQYLVPGAVFAWAYEHSGSIWTSILLHAAVNALAFWVMVA